MPLTSTVVRQSSGAPAPSCRREGHSVSLPRPRAVCTLAALTLGAPVLLAPSPAAAAVPTSPVYPQNSVTGLNAADGGGTVAAHHPKGDEDHQRWTPVAVSGGHLVLLQPLGYESAAHDRLDRLPSAVRDEPLPRPTRSATRPRPTTPSSRTAPGTSAPRPPAKSPTTSRWTATTWAPRPRSRPWGTSTRTSWRADSRRGGPRSIGRREVGRARVGADDVEIAAERQSKAPVTIGTIAASARTAGIAWLDRIESTVFSVGKVSGRVREKIGKTRANRYGRQGPTPSPLLNAFKFGLRSSPNTRRTAG